MDVNELISTFVVLIFLWGLYVFTSVMGNRVIPFVARKFKKIFTKEG